MRLTAASSWLVNAETSLPATNARKRISNLGHFVSKVYQVGTVSKAADSLHLTQPAVSQHVAGLEAILGTPLFQRLPRRMVPTAAGRRLYTQVVGAIEALESVPTKINLQADLAIRLGAPVEFFSEYVLPRVPCK